ncbi:MAG TPA: hypothetical protein VGL94_06345 [Ktedonobacteraceae bacterium]|jgi:hypothetical protein
MAENQKHQQRPEERDPQKHNHQEAGHVGGVAAQESGHAHHLTDKERREGGQAVQESGHAHQLTKADAKKGGKHSHQDK